MDQLKKIKEYTDKYRPDFNQAYFNRSDEDLIEAIRKLVYSCERDGHFTIKVTGFEVIDNYDDVNHILWECEDNVLNKGKKQTETKSKTKRVPKGKENQYAYINLKDSDLKIIKVDYFIQIYEMKNGLVSDNITVYIAIPRIVDGFYFRLNGNYYSAMYQIVDASTYNNTASKNAKKQSITFKTTLAAIRVYKYTVDLKDINGLYVPCTYFVVNLFTKSILLIEYFIAKMGFYESMRFLGITGVYFVDNIDAFSQETNYIFKVKDAYIVVDKLMYDSVYVVQSYVYTLYAIYHRTKGIKFTDIFETKNWIKVLGGEFTSKDHDTIIDKGYSILGSLEFIYDIASREDLKLGDEDKADIYRLLRWIMYEFNALRQKNNLDISTKKVRWAEYLLVEYATKLSNGIYRISDKGSKADLSTVRKALQIPPMYLIKTIISCPLVNYKDCVNDLDAITALKYTYKGPSGIGEKANAISDAYRSIHPSHLGRVDIDSSSNSDPGVSGTICPLAKLYDGHFSEYQEPSSWHNELAAVIDNYNKMINKNEMCKIIGDVKGIEQSSNITDDCIQVAKKLIDFSLLACKDQEYINGFDIFGDGYMFYEFE